MTVELQLKRLAKIRRYLSTAILHLDQVVELLEKDTVAATINLEVSLDYAELSVRTIKTVQEGIVDEHPPDSS